MSAAEEREKRRQRILASKDERMSRIITGTPPADDASTSDKPKPKAEPAAKAAQAPKEEPKPAKVNAAAAPIHRATPTSIQPPQQANVKPVPTPAKKGAMVIHVSVILFTAISFFLTTVYSAHPLCLSYGSSLCTVMDQSGYAIMTTMFCLAETGEYFTGRMGTSSLDARQLLKDLALYIFTILCLSHIQSMF